MSDAERTGDEADETDETPDESDTQSDVSLPPEHRAAIEALPDNLVQIISDGIQAGKSDAEIRADIEAAKKKQ